MPVTQYTSESAAVSEVIGTVILVGVVMVGITIVGTLLLSQPPPTEVPHFNAIISNQSEIVHILHKGGDSLGTGEFKILVDGIDRTSSFVNDGDDPWSVGETLSYTSPAMPRKVVIVFTGDAKGGEIILRGSELQPVLEVPSHPPSPPWVSWSSSPGFSNVTTNFTFTDSSTGKNITLYYWDFGDGNTSATQSLLHQFPCNTDPVSCTYSISHSATDSNGTNWETTSWLNRSGWVTVYRNLTPNVTFTQDKTTGPAGLLSVQFSATQVGGIKVDTWSWDFGDTGTSNSEDPSHTYTTKGIYTVTLTATNFTLGWDRVIKTNLILVTEPWYNCLWPYRKNITIDKTKVSGTQSNFPVLISFTDSDLSARAQGDGDDILFTDSTGNQLSHEIERYTSGTGELAAWVKVTSLPSGSNTTLFMYYGNPGATSQQSPENVWDTNFKAIWHHSNNNFRDSTSNNNDGTNSGTTNVVSAKIAGARSYDGSNDYVQQGSLAAIDQMWASGGTFSAWIYPTGLGGNSEGRIADKTDAATPTYGWNLFTYSGNTLRFRRAYYTTSSVVGTWTTPAITLSTWTYVVVNYTDGTSNDPNIFINGNLVSETEDTAPSGSQRSDASYNLRNGNRAGGTNRAFVGMIDEIRISKSLRSPEWVLTEYNNQGSPPTFHYRMTQEAWTC
jgi:PKD repeat protein